MQFIASIKVAVQIYHIFTVNSNFVHSSMLWDEKSQCNQDQCVGLEGCSVSLRTFDC